MRYRVGFPDKETKSGLTEANPGFPPVVEIGGPFILGRVVCICDNQQEAELIATLLNNNFAGLSKEWDKRR